MQDELTEVPTPDQVYSDNTVNHNSDRMKAFITVLLDKYPSIFNDDVLDNELQVAKPVYKINDLDDDQFDELLENLINSPNENKIIEEIKSLNDDKFDKYLADLLKVSGKKYKKRKKLVKKEKKKNNTSSSWS